MTPIPPGAVPRAVRRRPSLLLASGLTRVSVAFIGVAFIWLMTGWAMGWW